MEGVEGKLKVWIRRVWTLEMVSFDKLFLPEHPSYWAHIFASFFEETNRR